MPRGLNYDNKILSIVNTAVDMLILGIFWFVTSIPLVTIGASTTAVYYTVNKCIRNKKSYAYVEYWKAFNDVLFLSGIIGCCTGMGILSVFIHGQI